MNNDTVDRNQPDEEIFIPTFSDDALETAAAVRYSSVTYMQTACHTGGCTGEPGCH